MRVTLRKMLVRKAMLNYYSCMSSTAELYDQVKDEALHLPREDRSRLASRLLESLDRDDEISPEWLAEVRRRTKDIDEGRTKLISTEDVWKEINKEFGANL